MAEDARESGCNGLRAYYACFPLGIITDNGRFTVGVVIPDLEAVKLAWSAD